MLILSSNFVLVKNRFNFQIMSNSFFVILPSNTKSSVGSSTDFINKPNKFKVTLPRKISFDSGDTWVCGLHSIVYPNRYLFLKNNIREFVKK
jgi:hypothetical protein